MKNPDTLLITKPENIRYLSGFTGEGMLLIKPTRLAKRGGPLYQRGCKRVLLTDPRYLLRAREEKKPGFRLTVTSDSFAKSFTQTLKDLKTKKLGFEPRHLTVANLASLKKKSRKLKVKFVPVENAVENCRQVKSAQEILLIKKSCQITVRVLRKVLKFLKVGRAEIEVAEEIHRLALQFGAEKLAFDPIVGFGVSSACPHAKPGKKKLKKGDVVLLDLGVICRGYCSDLTRTFFTAPPTELQKQIYEVVRKSQQTGIQKVRAGVKASVVDKTVRDELRNPPQSPSIKGGSKREFEKQFTHSLGHGVGIEIHEAPSLSAKSKDILKAGNVVTVEPGIYLEKEKLGVRIEDTVVVTKSGARILTNFPKKLIVLDLE